jgi:hypothetical protein
LSNFFNSDKDFYRKQKVKIEMKKGKISIIIGGIIAAIIIGVFVVQFSEDSDLPKIVDVDKDGIPDDVDPFIATPRVWEKQTSGPFQIDREKYVLGELVLLRIGVQNELKPNEKGQIVFLQPPSNETQTVYITIPFDGSDKISFNQYFKPALSQNRGICSKADLLGNWTVVFQGVDYNRLKFEIVDRYIPGEEENYEEPVC